MLAIDLIFEYLKKRSLLTGPGKMKEDKKEKRGRPHIGRQITIRLTDEQIEKAEKLAKRHGRTRADVFRMMIDFGFFTYDQYSDVGVPQLAELFVKLRKKIRTLRQPSLFGNNG